jgi:hypothetical protein
MTHNSGLCTSAQKWIKTKMETPIHFNNKWNEVITWCSLNIWLCFLLSSHHSCMFYCRQCSLHHICTNQINNDDVHQGPKVVSSDKDIYSSLGVAREKVGDLLWNMCSILQNNSCNNISKCICALLHVHSHKGTKVNGYLGCQWYDHTNTVKNEPP